MGISLRSILVEFNRRQLVSERVPFAIVIVDVMGFEMLRLLDDVIFSHYSECPHSG